MPALFALLMLEPQLELPSPYLVDLLGAGDPDPELDPRDYLETIGPEAAPAIPGRGNIILPVRDWVCHTLGRIGEPALPALEEALPDENYLRRWTALRALGRIGKSAVPVLRQALDSGEDVVRLRAAMALASIGLAVALATPFLEAMLADQDDAVREAAADALVRIRGRRHRRGSDSGHRAIPAAG